MSFSPSFEFRRFDSYDPEVLLHLQSVSVSFSVEVAERLYAELGAALVKARGPASTVRVPVVGLTADDGRELQRLVRLLVAQYRAPQEGETLLPFSLIRALELLVDAVAPWPS